MTRQVEQIRPKPPPEEAEGALVEEVRELRRDVDSSRRAIGIISEVVIESLREEQKLLTQLRDALSLKLPE